jgi:AraC-like DNA-binding protein
MAVDDIDLKPKRFTTDELPERERLERWREEFGRTLVRVDMVPRTRGAPFHAEAVLQRLPGVHIAVCSGSLTHVERGSALIAADAGAGERIGLIINTAARLPAMQRNTELVLGEHDAVLVRHDEPCIMAGTTNRVGLAFPRAALAVRTDDLNGATMKKISRDDPALRLLLSYVRLIESDPELDKPALQQAIVNHVHDLAALVLGANRDTRELAGRSVGAARLKQAIAHVGRHFANPDLTIVSVAAAQDISPRYLQELFEQSGASFTARVNELRLKRAFALLMRFPGRTVSSIALEAGFSNVSHFNRLFRARFGETPNGVRGGD